MDWLDWEPILKKEAFELMQKSPGISRAHGLDHVERVWDRCLKLGMKLNADLEVLAAAAFLHDFGRHHGLAEIHGWKSAELAKPLLERIKFPKDKIEAVLHAIGKHDEEIASSERDTIESKVLYDADKMDVFGPVGVTRFVLHRFSNGINLEKIPEILSSIEKRFKGLYFKESREMVAEGYEYVVDFFKRLQEDLKVE